LKDFSQSHAIPTRTVAISDAAQLPHDYWGWALFSTTRGGTQIFYDRKFLLDCLNSPMARTPPCHLPNIPGVSSPGTLIEDSRVEVNNLNNINNHERKHAVGDDAQFEMDI
uniref:Eukaryotic translation initiation factor 4E binding protein 2 n=1 Tax=Mandrillus leucophaeus TaxID=9568 RepID=A0A2K5Z4X4_MANLE